MLAVDAEIFPGRSFEERHDLRDLGEHAIRRVIGLREAEALQKLDMFDGSFGQFVDNFFINSNLTLTLGAKFEDNSFSGEEFLPNVRLAWSRPGAL